ncbi:MAG: tetratricopeptide repeat protein [Bacteroidales bacterium]|nr:tetratricopeptide repeat protein [Bacteroidales bacterium]
MMKRKFIFIAVLAFLSGSFLVSSSAEERPDGFREALRLIDRGFGPRASSILMLKDDVNAKGYDVLIHVLRRTEGYEAPMHRFLEENPHIAVVPQIKYAYALNLFDDGDFKGALEIFDNLDVERLHSDQKTEYLFKKAYACLENHMLTEAVKGFELVQELPMNDYVAPSRYILGYINYETRYFAKALSWFEKSVEDSRFSEMSSYYIMECRFMLGDHAYVAANAERMLGAVPVDRKANTARLISESLLVLGDADQARKYYDMAMGGGETPETRTEWFYSGSVLYAVKDYEGAIRSYSHMTERSDSLGQIANYHLGYSYIQTKNKVAALTAFKEAAQVWYSPAIAEDAYFNWAKLAFDINHDPSVFNDYLKKYPVKEQSDRINNYIAVAALYDRDYATAIEAYDRIDELDDGMVLNYMKANYLRANQLVSSGSYRLAIPCLKASAYYSDKSSRFNQLSRFWLAESYYRNDQYDDAIGVFENLYNTQALYRQPESYVIPYCIGYSHYKKGAYGAAMKWFDIYLEDNHDHLYRKEAMERRADCYFIQKQYDKAAKAYDLVLKEYFDVNDIYAYYQSALAYGLLNRNSKKIELLSNVMKASPSSEFYPEAMFELGRAYVAAEKDESAFECFNRIVKNVKDYNFVAKAYVEMGSLARNQSQYNEALVYYKKVVEEMAFSDYSDDAMAAIESIYQTKNDPEEYIAYIESIGKGASKTESEKETMIFNSAEQVYLSGNYDKAVTSLKAYLDKYPAGKNAYKADFYMAESYRSLGKLEQACDSYANVIQDGEGSFVELSMLNFSRLSYQLERWEDAFGGYSSLYSAALLENNKHMAIIGMMRSAFKAHKWSDAVANADRLLASDRADSQSKAEALYIKAKSYLASSRRDEAFSIVADLAKDVTTEYGAEAAYMLIVDSYDKGEFEDVENKVYALSDAGTPYVYWLAKSFIILGDSFVEREEFEQAKATFQSLMDGYQASGPEDDVLDNVSMRMKKLDEMMVE